MYDKAVLRYSFYLEPRVKDMLKDISNYYDTQTSITLTQIIENEYKRIKQAEAVNGSQFKK